MTSLAPPPSRRPAASPGTATAPARPPSPKTPAPAAPSPAWHHLATQSHPRPRLRIGPVDDPAERAADRIADQVLATPASHHANAPAAAPPPGASQVRRQCAACASGAAPCAECAADDEETANVQRHPASPAARGPAFADADLPDRLGPGQALEPGVRAFFEPRFGADLGAVRIHTDPVAEDAAGAMGAHAFALGRHVAFAPGQYQPGSHAGRHLLAHELAHVVRAEAGAGGSHGVQRSAVEEAWEPYPGPPRDGPEPIHGGELPFEPPSGTAPGGGPPPAPEECPPPEELECPTARDHPATVTHTFVFPVGSALLSPRQRGEINAAARAWNAPGSPRPNLRLDGYASAEGDCDRNWSLSCQRARAVADALTAPSDGSPGVSSGSLERFAHGESDAAGSALEPNRRATISLPAPKPPTPVPGPGPGTEPGPTPGPCVLPVSLGKGRGCASGPDFTHFDFPALSPMSEAKLAAWAVALHPQHLPLRSGVSNAACITELSSVLGALAGMDGLAAVSRFVAGTGGTMTHAASSATLGTVSPTAPTRIGGEALASPSFQASVATVKADVETQLATQAAGGALNPCALSITPPQTHFGFGDSVALKGLIGGTQGEEVFATAFVGDPLLRTYTMDLQFKICDDFGVDETDLYSPGLFAFWVLQHERSASRFAPFVNELDLSVTISGTF